MPLTRGDDLKCLTGKNDGGGGYRSFFFFFFLFNFSNFQDFTLEKFGDWRHRLWEDDSTNLAVIREFQMEFRECCKCISLLHQNIKKGL